MSPEQVDRTISEAEARGYRLRTRHQPAVELEDPDWIVVIETPDGRVLFPGAIDDEEHRARHRAAVRLAEELRAEPHDQRLLDADQPEPNR
ncbi:hypothetical protein [Nocardioides mangrovi]|uniref:Uncharacterized protein n=1 Tax=Nocardioides mangrovi TaxID=2874580 RepID=A0ABS7UEU5_9ACTN|nr:hypothetical protein [Nocardioides mangrovi]MBZ5739539.1 hypothetical protein [Nocardioides mangrovi]